RESHHAVCRFLCVRGEYVRLFERGGSEEKPGIPGGTKGGGRLSGQVKKENESRPKGPRPCRVPFAATRALVPLVPRSNPTAPYTPLPVHHGVPAHSSTAIAPRETYVYWHSRWPRSWWGGVPPKRSVARSRCRYVRNCVGCAAVCPAAWPPGSCGCSTSRCAPGPWRSAPSSPVITAPECLPSEPGGRAGAGSANTWRSTVHEPEKSMDFSIRAPIGSPEGKNTPHPLPGMSRLCPNGAPIPGRTGQKAAGTGHKASPRRVAAEGKGGGLRAPRTLRPSMYEANRHQPPTQHQCPHTVPRRKAGGVRTRPSRSGKGRLFELSLVGSHRRLRPPREIDTRGPGQRRRPFARRAVDRLPTPRRGRTATDPRVARRRR